MRLSRFVFLLFVASCGGDEEGDTGGGTDADTDVDSDTDTDADADTDADTDADADTDSDSDTGTGSNSECEPTAPAGDQCEQGYQLCRVEGAELQCFPGRVCAECCGEECEGYGCKGPAPTDGGCPTDLGYLCDPGDPGGGDASCYSSRRICDGCCSSKCTRG